MNQLKQVCVVSGASGGIGKAIVEKFHIRGYHVVMIDIDEEKIKAAIQWLRLSESDVTYHVLDIADENQVKIIISKIYQQVGRIDALVNAAGICGQYAKTIDYSFENFKKIYSVNVFGTFLMMQNVLPIMIKQKFGAIVNFGSVSGMRGYSYEIGYGSSKWAVIGMSKNVANEYGSYGIRSNIISPGWVKTDMMKQTLENYKTLNSDEIDIGPLKRPAEPFEIADAVFFLCSNEAKYINGANLVIDGGKLCD